MIHAIQNRDYLLRSQYEREKVLLIKLGCREIRKSLYFFYEDGKKLYLDYRNSTKKSWAVDINNKSIDKRKLFIYQTIKAIINDKYKLS